MCLRAENLHALENAGISDTRNELLFYPDLQKLPCNNFALVDHNRLGSAFSGKGAQVVAVVDHHEDEGFHKDTAKPRIIAPAGSCASHITKELLQPLEQTAQKLPPELSTLLLSAILIDTSGLRPGGKALDVDRAAAEFLFPLSTLSQGATTNSSLGPDPIQSLSDTLHQLKGDVSHLSARDLLRRDYKEYSYQVPWLGSSIRAGLATVPLQLQAWGQEGRLLVSTRAWMKERGLTVLGVLTSFNNKKGKHRRQMAWFIADESTERCTKIQERLWSGIEGDAQLEAKAHVFKDLDPVVENDHLRCKTYKQKNAKATRKAVAPLLKSIMESVS